SSETLSQLDLRSAILEVLSSTPLLQHINLRKAVAARAVGASAYVEVLGRVQGKEGIDAFAEILPRLLELQCLPMFPDESETAATADAIDRLVVTSSLYAGYVESRIPSVPWDYMEENSDLLVVATSLTVGEQAVGIPVDLRRMVADRASQELRRLQGGADKLIANLGSATDETDSVPPERVRQFDLLFAADPTEFATIAMRMIVAGASLDLITKVCTALSESFPTAPSDLFTPPFLYSETIWCVVGAPRNPAFAGVFRKGVDHPIAALDRIAATVVAARPPPPPEPEHTSSSYRSPSTTDMEPSFADSIPSGDWDLDEDIVVPGKGWDVDAEPERAPVVAIRDRVPAPPTFGSDWDLDEDIIIPAPAPAPILPTRIIQIAAHEAPAIPIGDWGNDDLNVAIPSPPVDVGGDWDLDGDLDVVPPRTDVGPAPVSVAPGGDWDLDGDLHPVSPPTDAGPVPRPVAPGGDWDLDGDLHPVSPLTDAGPAPILVAPGGVAPVPVVPAGDWDIGGDFAVAPPPAPAPLRVAIPPPVSSAGDWDLEIPIIAPAIVSGDWDDDIDLDIPPPPGASGGDWDVDRNLDVLAPPPAGGDWDLDDDLDIPLPAPLSDDDSGSSSMHLAPVGTLGASHEQLAGSLPQSEDDFLPDGADDRGFDTASSVGATAGFSARASVYTASVVGTRMSVASRFSTAMATSNGTGALVEEAMRMALGEVVEDTGRFGADVCMQVLELLQRRFVVGTGDVKRFQLAKLASIVKEAWGLDITQMLLDDDKSQTTLFELLLGRTNSPEQAQSLVAVLAEWLTPPAPNAVEPFAVPEHLNASWRDLMLWMTRRGEWKLLMETRVEFGGFDVLTEDGEDTVLSTIQTSGPDVEYIKHGLLSRRDALVLTAAATLRSRINATPPNTIPPPPLLADRHIHTLLCARGLSGEFVSTPLWPHLVSTLAHAPPSLGIAAVVDATSAGCISAAAALALDRLGCPPEVAAGLQVRLAVLARFLADVVHMGVPRGGGGGAIDPAEEIIVERFLWGAPVGVQERAAYAVARLS
ncbi:hypothetical protein BDK51DRAFT_31082, partial [Blyttiomyces helicus]